MVSEVLQQKADAGFAFDGDGDRVIAVDDRGNVLSGDRILAICSALLKKEGKLKNNLVVRTVMSNLGLSVAFEELGIDSVFTKVGDRFVLEEMLARGAVMQVLAAIKKEGKTLSELAGIMTVFPQMLINIDVRRKPEIETVPEIMAAIKQVEENLGNKGRVLVRYSGTQNMCRVMVEGPTKEETQTFCRQIADVVETILS